MYNSLTLAFAAMEGDVEEEEEEKVDAEVEEASASTRRYSDSQRVIVNFSIINPEGCKDGRSRQLLCGEFGLSFCKLRFATSAGWSRSKREKGPLVARGEVLFCRGFT